MIVFSGNIDGAGSFATSRAKGWRGAGDPGGALRLASTDGGAQRQDPAAHMSMEGRR
jgi:hypothetical protein